MFRGMDRDPRETWSLACYHVCLWASISKTLCNYSIRMISYSWSPFVTSRVLDKLELIISNCWALIPFNFWILEPI